MGKFLDSTGVLHLWNKIKSEISNKTKEIETKLDSLDTNEDIIEILSDIANVLELEKSGPTSFYEIIQGSNGKELIIYPFNTADYTKDDFILMALDWYNISIDEEGNYDTSLVDETALNGLYGLINTENGNIKSGWYVGDGCALVIAPEGWENNEELIFIIELDNLLNDEDYEIPAYINNDILLGEFIDLSTYSLSNLKFNKL